jgi:hypothetical protein
VNGKSGVEAQAQSLGLALARLLEARPGLKRAFRALRRADPPEAWTHLYRLGEGLPEDVLRGAGLLAATFRQARFHPASLFPKDPAGERRFYRLLRARTPVEVALALTRQASYLGGALDLGEAVRGLALWGDGVRLEWARVYAREDLGGEEAGGGEVAVSH